MQPAIGDGALDRYNNIRTELCAIILSGTTDINELAAITRRSYKKTVGHLEDIIYLSKSSHYANSQQVWKAFRGASIDYEKKRIVLAAPVDEMLVHIDEIEDRGRVKERYVWCVLSLIFSVVFLCAGIYAAPQGLAEKMMFAAVIGVFVGYSLFAFLSAKIIKARTKRLGRYFSLVSEEQVTSIRKMADITSRSPELVKKDLKNAIKNKVFFNVRIDEKSGEVVTGESGPHRVKTARSQTWGKLILIFSLIIIGWTALLSPVVVSEIILSNSPLRQERAEIAGMRAVPRYGRRMREMKIPRGIVNFRLPDGTEKELEVEPDLYDSLQKGETGMISYKEKKNAARWSQRRFISFEKDG